MRQKREQHTVSLYPLTYLYLFLNYIRGQANFFKSLQIANPKNLGAHSAIANPQISQLPVGK
jgi:hypothetical protein